MVYWKIPVFQQLGCCFFDVLFLSDVKTEWEAAPTIASLQFTITMHGFESQHCHLLVKATKLQLSHRDGCPTLHPFTTVCSRVCLVSPCLNTEHKASHTVKTMPLNTQWMPFNCLFFCWLPLVRFWALCHPSILCCVSIYTLLSQCLVLVKVKKSCVLAMSTWK